MVRLSDCVRLVVLSLTGVAIVGCSKSEGTRGDSATAAIAETTPAGRSQTTSLRPLEVPDANFISSLASGYAFGPKRSPTSIALPPKSAKNKGVEKKNSPVDLNIQTAILTGPATEPAIVALITSDKEYPGLGIEKDSNYIVRDKRGSSDALDWVTYMVSVRPFGMIRLDRGTDALLAANPHEPRIVSYEFQQKVGTSKPMTVDMVAFGLCIDDPKLCTTGHCGYNY